METLREFIAHAGFVLREYAGGSGSAGGLLIGDPGSGVRKVLLAPGLSADVASEALGARADLIVMLRTPRDLPLAGAEGAHVRELIAAGVAVLSVEGQAHGLVAEAFIGALDVGVTEPLIPSLTEEYAMVVVYVPEEDAEHVRRALAAAGAGAIGDYSGCAWSVTGTGEFTPGQGADPTIGTVGDHEQVRERRVEMVVPLDLVAEVTTALRRAHPYEEPAFSFLMTHGAPGRTGRGRRGLLPEPVTLGEVRDLLARHIPGGAVRVSGEDGLVREIAVISRADEGVIDAAIDAGVDLLVSSDLSSAELRRAHAAGLHLIDVPRAAMEWFALPLLARRLAAGTDGEIETIVTATSEPTWRSG